MQPDRVRASWTIGRQPDPRSENVYDLWEILEAQDGLQDTVSDSHTAKSRDRPSGETLGENKPSESGMRVAFPLLRSASRHPFHGLREAADEVVSIRRIASRFVFGDTVLLSQV